MPPLSPPGIDNILVGKPEPYYTNEGETALLGITTKLTHLDVAILHEIVVHAEELLPSLPERERVPTNALFHAYYAILSSFGLHADHDSRYARVLFKIGGTRGSGSLYEKFEVVLSRMGIEIQFDQETSHESNDSARESYICQASHSPSVSASALAQRGQSRGRRRRKSESSVWEMDLNLLGRHGAQPRSHSLSRAFPGLSAQIVHNSEPVQTMAETTTAPLSYAQPRGGAYEQGKGRGFATWLNANRHHDLQKPSARSASTQGSMRVQRRPSTFHDEDANSTISASDSDHRASSNQRAKVPNSNNKMANSQNPQILRSTPEALLDIKVTLFRQYQLRNLARNMLVRWREKALRLREKNANLGLLAKHRDKEVLLQQAIFSWQTNVRGRRQEAETEFFFSHLGRRAGRARDLFLLTKAFTHWAKSTSDEIQRTSVARRHILRTRYFDAWLEITAVNELKVRRQILRKFFTAWKKCYTGIIATTANLIIAYEGNLVERMFWAWVWAFYERRAPVWWATRKEREIFSIWLGANHANMEDENMAIEHYHYLLKRRIHYNWTTKLRQHITQDKEALGSSGVNLSLKILVHWRRGVALLSVLHKLRGTMGARLKHEYLRFWHLRALQEKQANAFDQLKITREAWATWSDKLRCRAFRSRIDDRLVFQGLYRWVLNERLILVGRLVDRRLMQIVLQIMAEKSNRIIKKEVEDLDLAQYSADRILTSQIMRKLRSRLEIQLQRDRIVTEYRSPVLSNRILNQWMKRAEHTCQLRNWAHNAVFYFLTSKTLKVWKNATDRIKRDKIRKSYGQIRRRIKMNNGWQLLSVWRRQANIIMDIRSLAAEVYHNKKMISVLEIFDQWRGRTEELAGLVLSCEQPLLKKRFYDMRRTFSAYQHLEIEAIRYFEDCTNLFALKKWGRVALQLRARQHLVVELREKQGRKVLRKIISHWNQWASEKRQSIRREQNICAGLNKSTLGIAKIPEIVEMWSELGGDTDINTWTDADGINDEDNSSTPFPGYLSTPSRKSSRARAIARFSSTTPTAPLSTPFEKRLRAQYSNGSEPPSRRAWARSKRDTGSIGVMEIPTDIEE